MAKVRALIGHFTRSPKNMSELIKIQRTAGGKGLRLLQDMVVRWLSTANALKRLVLLRSPVLSFFNSNDHEFENPLSPQEWKAVQGILAVIEFGRQVSTMLRTETQSWLSNTSNYSLLITHYSLLEFLRGASNLRVIFRNYLEAGNFFYQLLQEFFYKKP